MVKYLYTLTYDDGGAAASVQHYMVNETRVTTSQALTATTTPLPNTELVRHTKMLNNVAVCAIAQKYDIGELKDLAIAKFRTLLWLTFPSHGLPDIIRAVFETTSITDPGLRNVVVEYYAQYSTWVVADEHLSSVIKEYGELGLDVLRGVDEYANENNEQKELLQGKLNRVKGELTQMSKKASKIKAPMRDDALVAALLAQLRTTLDNVKS